MSSSLVYLAWLISICLMIWSISSSVGAMFGRTASGHMGVLVVLCGTLVDDLFVRIKSNHVCHSGALFDSDFIYSRLVILCLLYPGSSRGSPTLLLMGSRLRIVTGVWIIVDSVSWMWILVAFAVGRFIIIISNVTITISVCIVECNKGVWSSGGSMYGLGQWVWTGGRLAGASVSLLSGGWLVSCRLILCGLARLG